MPWPRKMYGAGGQRAGRHPLNRAGIDPHVLERAAQRRLEVGGPVLAAGRPADGAARQLDAEFAVEDQIDHEQILPLTGLGAPLEQPVEQIDAVGVGRDVAGVGRSDRGVAGVAVGERVEPEAAVGAGGVGAAVGAAQAIQSPLEAVDEDVGRVLAVLGVGVGDAQGVADARERKFAAQARRDPKEVVVAVTDLAAVVIERVAAGSQGRNRVRTRLVARSRRARGRPAAAQ